MATESKRQLQVGQLLSEELSRIFLKLGLNTAQGGLISIAKVSMTPDLLEAKVYLSIFKVEDEQAYFDNLATHHSEIRGMLGNSLRNHLRRIPTLQFIKDDTLDYVFKIEALLDQIKKDDQK
jgi:ribosome-binding factor A